VKGGGKFGTIYGMYIDSRDNAKPIDEIFDFEGMKVYINSPSLELLNGATLDYVGQPDAPVFRHLEDFKITNPNDPPRAVDIEVKQSEDEEEDRALYCPRCGWVVISNEEMVGFPCTHQPACEHVQYVFDDFNNEFLYLSDELDERISALRQAAEDKEDEFGDGEFSDFDWAFEEGPKEFDTLQRTDEGMACGPVAYTVVVGFERGEVSNRKRHVVTKPKRQQMTGHAPETEDIDIGRGKAVTEEFLALHQKDYYPCPENRKAIMDWFNTAGLLDEWTLANLEDCFRQLSTAGKLIAPAEAK
jgi:Fe-S cluster assembly iron-binding protein IscA